MRRTLLLVLLLVASALAGCFGAPDDVGPTGAPGGGGADGGDGDGSAPPGDDGGPTAKDGGPGWTWAEPGEAKIRPGTQVTSEVGQCTTNFVFTSPDRRAVYVGAAAHCVEGMDVGDPVKFVGAGVTGTLAYNSWATMEAVGEKDAAALDYNDFALIRVPDEARGLVSPAMEHFGGPTGLANSSEAGMGDKVLTYGNSSLRMGLTPANPHEGYITSRPHPWTMQVYTATPGVPGDSGSGMLTADGQALGVVVTLTIAPTAGSNGVTSLDMALAYAAEHGDVHVELATWDQARSGLLPAASGS